LSHLDLLTPTSLILNSLNIAVDDNVIHGGIQRFPLTLARKAVDHSFSRLENGYTHMSIHQSHLMAPGILFKGGGNCIHDFALHVLTYLLTLVVDITSLKEIFISCHDFSSIELSANTVYVDDSIVLARLIPHTINLKQSGKTHISPCMRKELLKREEYYQWVMTYLVTNFNAVFQSYLSKTKDLKERKELIKTLSKRLVPREQTSAKSSSSS